MFQKKRTLKKEKSKQKLKYFLIGLFLLIICFFVIEYLYLNFSFGRTVYISPIAKNKTSQVSTLENKLEQKNIQFTSVSASPDSSLIVNLKGGGVVILSSKKDIGSQITSLQLILSGLTIEGKKLNTLDFRFDNPVVSF